MSDAAPKVEKEEKTPRRKLSKKQKWLVALSAVMAFLLLFLGVCAFLFYNTWGLFKQSNPYSIPQPPVMQEDLNYERDGVTYQYNPDVVNILLLGVQMQQENLNIMVGPQADVLLLLSLNIKTGEADLLPIPRDTTGQIISLDVYDEIFELNEGPICNAYAMAGQDGELGGRLTEAVVSDLFYNLPIHRFVSVNMNCIKEITEFVGGVPVEVTADFVAVADVPAGETILLDAEMAELYIRGRSMGGMDGTNLSRMVRQRQYLFSLLDVVKQKTKQNPLFALRLYAAMSPYIYTDLGLREMAFLGGQVLFSDIEFQLHIMEGEMVELEYVVDEAFLRWYIEETCFIEA